MNRPTALLAAALLLAAGLAPAGAARADGFIVIPHPPVSPRPIASFPLEVTYHQVTVEIRDQVATTSVDQSFRNPNDVRLEGWYLFPIPAGAVIEKFSMFIDGRETEAELLDAGKARSLYEEIIRSMRDPALLEYDGRGLFRVRVFPIEPRSEKRIRLSYHELITRENGTWQYTYPLNTEKFSAAPLERASIRVDLATGDPLKGIWCPTHEVEIIRRGPRAATVGWEERGSRPDRDFTLCFGTATSDIGFSLLTYREPGEDGYFVLNVSPGLLPDQEVAAKDIVFVLDVSGSMAGDKLRQAKKALLFCVENLNRDDRFDIVRFATEAEALFPELSGAGEGKRERAREFIEGLKAIGGTNVEEALRLALGLRKGSRRPFSVVFITDGKPTIGEIDEDRLVAGLERADDRGTRIFTFGIGTDINTHLLDRITEKTRAWRTYVSPTEDLELAVSSFYTKVQSPVLTDPALEVGGGIRLAKVYPRELPDLFRGSSLTVLGRYDGSGPAEVTLAGMVGDRRRVFRWQGNFPRESRRADFLPSLWAARRVGWLLDQIRLHGEERELVDEVTSLARAHGIVTPYTSYLILEDERARITRGDLAADRGTVSSMIPRKAPLEESNRREFESFKREKSGVAGVRASTEAQALNQAASAPQIVQGSERLEYKDEGGKTRNLAQQVKNVQGRAFYQSGDTWVDASLQARKPGQLNRVQFASREYFELLKKEPLAAQFMSLGQSVRFVLADRLYEIYQ